MLNNIKSIYFLRLIMTYIDEGKKLELIMYNKIIQNKLEIGIINYKFFCGKYKVVDKNGKSQVFFGANNEMIFEGKYVNGKKNGKGKEYDYNGNLIFEGEYLNGKRNGKGKEYDYDGDLIFEGEYLNGKRNGKGKEYDYDGKLKFEGEYLDGNILIKKEYEKDGKNFKVINNKKELFKKYNEKNTLKLENNYINGLINGKGIEYYEKDKIKFEGEYLFGKKGNEKDNDKDENIYELYNDDWLINEFSYKLVGQYSYGAIKGEIKELYYNDKILIKGYYINAKKNGKGKHYDRDGNLEFEGEYLYNRKRKGKEYYKNGKLRFEGEYLYDKKWNGKGYDMEGNKIYELINGNGPVIEYQQDYDYPSFKGEYLDGKRNSKGKEYYYNKIQFDGEYLNGKRNGKGKEYRYSNFIAQNEEYLPEEKQEKRIEYRGTNVIYDGEYLNGKRHGKGKEYRINGTLKYDGEFSNGKKHGKGKLYNDYGKLKFEGHFENDICIK